MGVHWMKEFLNSNQEYENLIEIIDLRTLLPWDKDLVYKVLKKQIRL